MSKTGVLGAFEEMVLLAVLHQGDEAFGVSIRRELQERCESDVAMGAVYATLDRLENKGLVKSRVGERHVSRRGRPRRYYDIQPAGAAELERTLSVRDRMWEGIELPAHARSGDA